MSLAVVLSRGLSGLDAPLVTVEVHLGNGLPGFNLVGLPETEVKESRDRVRAALQNAGFEFPVRKITLGPKDRTNAR
jgi:magnesium chelatase family protein